MAYWRKILLAVFALCLGAGMAFALPMTCPTDETCLDNMMLVGDVSYDGSCDPDLDCPCQDFTWPLEYVHFDCDEGFIDVGRCHIRPQEVEGYDYEAYKIQGYLPHELAWDEDDRLLYISYMQPESPSYQGLDASPLITIFDPVNQVKWNFSASDFGLPDEWNYDPGGLAIDDVNDILYILNRDPDDARLRAFDVSDPCCPKELTCCQCTLCIDDDCLDRYGFDEHVGKWELTAPGEMDFLDGKLYVTYMCRYKADWKWYPIIAKWDVETCELEGLVLVQCEEVCEDNCTFPVTSIEVKKDTLKDGDEKVLAFLTHYPVYKACEIGCRTSWLHMVNITDSMGGQYSGISLNTEDIGLWGALICDEDDDIVLKGLDVDTGCDCGDACEDGVVYVAAKLYADDWCVPDKGMVLAFSYGWGSDGCDPKLTFKTKKEFPCWYTPGDLVATHWIPETTVEVSAEDCSEVTIDITHLCAPECWCEDVCELPLNLYFDPDIVEFVSATVKLGDFQEIDLEPVLTDRLDEGVAYWEDILHGFYPECLDENETVVVKATFNVIGSGEMTVWAFAGDCIEAAGYECLDCSGGTPCPAFAYEIDGATLTEGDPSDENLDIPYLAAFTMEADNGCDPCEGGSLCLYVNTLEDKAPRLWQFDGETWTELEPEVDEDVEFEGCDYDYELCISWDAGTDFTGLEWIVAEGKYNDPTDATDLEDDDGNGGGGSGSSSSGCNVGFSVAALLFAVPLVSIFRKR